MGGMDAMQWMDGWREMPLNTKFNVILEKNNNKKETKEEEENEKT
jgi:hypothetical protein